MVGTKLALIYCSLTDLTQQWLIDSVHGVIRHVQSNLCLSLVAGASLQQCDGSAGQQTQLAATTGVAGPTYAVPDVFTFYNRLQGQLGVDFLGNFSSYDLYSSSNTAAVTQQYALNSIAGSSTEAYIIQTGPYKGQISDQVSKCADTATAAATVAATATVSIVRTCCSALPLTLLLL